MPDLLPILKYPDPFLKRKTQPVERVTAEIRELAERMVETMFDAHGLGLAATQVGLDLRMAVVSGKGERGDEIVVINPRIVEAWGSEALEEGCLSFPGIHEEIERAEKVTVRAQDVHGNFFEVTADGLLAVALQHEYDHLEGTLMVDRVSLLKRRFIDREMKRRQLSDARP